MTHFVLSGMFYVHVYVFDILLQVQCIYLKHTSTGEFSVTYTASHFPSVLKNKKPCLQPAAYLCPKSERDASGALSSPSGPFLQPPRIVLSPPPSNSTTIQACMAAGSCAVVWFLLYRHSTCTWQQFFFCMHVRVSLASPTVFDVISLYLGEEL